MIPYSPSQDLVSMVEAIVAGSAAEHSFDLTGTGTPLKFQQSYHEVPWPDHRSDGDNDSQYYSEPMLSTTDDLPTSSFTPLTTSNFSNIDTADLDSCDEISLSLIDDLPLSALMPPQFSNCSSVTGEVLDFNDPNNFYNVTCQPEEQNVPLLLPSPPTSSLKDTPSLDESPNAEPEKSRKRKRRTTSECSNTSIEGKKKSRNIDDKPQYVCRHPGCEKVFGYPHTLRRHLLLHSGEKAFACEHCGKRFTLKGKLTYHVRLKHTKRKDTTKHVCHIPNCGRVFTFPWNLKRHLELHSDKKSFVCKHCEKRFARKEHLNKHLRRHTSLADNGTKTISSVTKASQTSRDAQLTRTDSVMESLKSFLHFKEAPADG